MKVAIIIAPRDFKDETLATLRLLLKKWDVDVAVSSYTSAECIGYHGATCVPDLNAAKVFTKDFDALILADGVGIEKYKLYDFRPLLDMVKHFDDEKKLIVAISNGIKILARANIVANKNISTPDDEETKRMVQLYKGMPSENAVEIDGNLLTAGDTETISQLVNALLGQLGVK